MNGNPREPYEVGTDVAAAPRIDPELEALRASLTADQPSFLGDLERLVNIDSGSGNVAGVDEIALWTAAFLTDIGASVELRPDLDGELGSTVLATLQGDQGGPRLLIIGHTDTVFDVGTAANRPFRIVERIAYGPGVSDMKGGLLSGLYAMKALTRECKGLPFEQLTLIANPDEEIGSPSSEAHIIAAAAHADACLVLESARANGDVVSARKGMIHLRLTIQGKGAHAGIEPEKGSSAVLEGARLVRELHHLNGRWGGVTVNVGRISGGSRPDVVPEHCDLDIDVRTSTESDHSEVESIIRALVATSHFSTSIQTSVLASSRPMTKTPQSLRLLDHAKATAASLGFAVQDTATGGASNANTTSGIGVPSLDGLGPIGGSYHSTEEYLVVDSIIPRTTLLAGLILKIGRDPTTRDWAR